MAFQDAFQQALTSRGKSTGRDVSTQDVASSFHPGQYSKINSDIAVRNKQAVAEQIAQAKTDADKQKEQIRQQAKQEAIKKASGTGIIGWANRTADKVFGGTLDTATNAADQAQQFSSKAAKTVKAGAGGVYGLADAGLTAIGDKPGAKRIIEGVDTTLTKDLSNNKTFFKDRNEAQNISPKKLAIKTASVGVQGAQYVVPGEAKGLGLLPKLGVFLGNTAIGTGGNVLQQLDETGKVDKNQVKASIAPNALISGLGVGLGSLGDVKAGISSTKDFARKTAAQRLVKKADDSPEPKAKESASPISEVKKPDIQTAKEVSHVTNENSARQILSSGEIRTSKAPIDGYEGQKGVSVGSSDSARAYHHPGQNNVEFVLDHSKIKGSGDNVSYHGDEAMIKNNVPVSAIKEVKVGTPELAKEFESKGYKVTVDPELNKTTAKPLEASGTSKIAKSIETKTIEKKLSGTFGDLAGYDKITIKDQAERVGKLLDGDPEQLRRIVRGEEKLPDGVKSTAFVTGVEEHALKNGDTELLRDLAKSEHVSESSRSAQELRLAAEREPDSAVAKIRELAKERQKAFESKNKGAKVTTAVSDTAKEIKASVKKSTKMDWGQFVESIKC